MYRPLQADMPPAYKLYLELTEFNNLPCMAYVNRRLKYYATQLGGSQFKVDLAADFHFRYSIHVPWENKSTVMNYDHIKRFWIDSVGMTTFLAECYPFNNNESPVTDSSVGRIPETLKRTQCQGSDPCDIFARAVPPADFDDWLQDNLDHEPYYFAADNEQFTVKEALWQRGLSRFTLNLGDKISRVCNIPFILMPQLHSWFLDNVEIHFEPTNELIDLITNLGISRGARGLILYAWNSNKDNPSESEYSRGLTERGGTLRQQNVYQQEKTKKQTVIDLVNRVEKWEPYLMSFDNANRKAFTYQNQTEREQMIAGTFIRQLLTYPCISYAPDTIPDLDNIQLDAQNKTYLEATFFANPFDGGREKYFMLVNRRCSPFYNFTSADSIGGRRILAMKTNASALEGFNNWKLIDIESGRHIITFDKNDTCVIFTGDIMPGAAKLYKLAPVMQEGGTLVADEDCGGFEFECRGEVNNNGHDITIVPNTTILFANTTARIIMDGGSFHSGSSSESYPIYLNAKTGASWKGLKLGGCEEVELHQTYFNGVSPYPVDSTYAAELTDCSSINISNCTFSSLSTGKTGSLLIAYSSQGDPEGVYLSSNYFNLNTGSMPAISVIATGYDEVPLLMEWNEFESCSENSTLAILLSNVTGGAIKENNFTGYDKTGFMLGSSIDFYGNYIIGSDQSSVGIVQHSASNANLSASGEMFTGGFNSVTAEGQTAKCIQLNNSYLLIDEGYNIFRLEDSQTNNYHLEGTIPNDVGADPYPAENNCFQLGNGLLVKHNLRWIDETAINLDTVPSSCNSERPESFMVFNLDNGINDTVRYESGCSGGGESNVKLEIKITNMEKLQGWVNF
ncbi:MAG: hypothetical protein IPL67_03535 [Ignavibacteria bacterium]|nr:hypothetical protein [Ignavibacteria bacterium]